MRCDNPKIRQIGNSHFRLDTFQSAETALLALLWVSLLHLGSLEDFRFLITLNTKILVPVIFNLIRTRFSTILFKTTLSLIFYSFRGMFQKDLGNRAPVAPQVTSYLKSQGRFVISAVLGCQLEGGIMDCNLFAQSKDRSSRKCLILGDGSCRVSKGHILMRQRKKVVVTTCLPQKASSAHLLQLIESLLLHVKLWKIPKDRHIRVKVRKWSQQQTEINHGTQIMPPDLYQLKVKLPRLLW